MVEEWIYIRLISTIFFICLIFECYLPLIWLGFLSVHSYKTQSPKHSWPVAWNTNSLKGWCMVMNGNLVRITTLPAWTFQHDPFFLSEFEYMMVISAVSFAALLLLFLLQTSCLCVCICHILLLQISCKYSAAACRPDHIWGNKGGLWLIIKSCLFLAEQGMASSGCFRQIRWYFRVAKVRVDLFRNMNITKLS